MSSTSPYDIQRSADSGSPVTIDAVARAWPTRTGRSAEAAGGNTPSAISGSPNVASLFRKNEIAGQRELEAAAKAASAHEGGRHCLRVQQVFDQRVHRRQHGADAIRRVLRDTGAEAEVASLPFDRDQLEMRILLDGVEAGAQRVDDLRRDDVAGRVGERERRARLIRIERDVNRHPAPA
jgi:hypothetical protein